MAKYGSNKYDAPADKYFFNPIAELFVDSFHKIGLTPNIVTILSTIIQISCVIPLLYGRVWICIFLYLTGYMFDCVDGKMARKFNQGSALGMVLDFDSDMLVNTVVLGVSAYIKLNIVGLIIVLIFTFLDNIYYGFVEAINCQKKKESEEVEIKDNFYWTKVNALKDFKRGYFNDFLKAMFLQTHKTVYNQYRYLMPVYDDVKAHKFMSIIRYFGPGTNCLVIAFYLLCLKDNMILEFSIYEFESG